ncbi:hypothetical protein BCR34DRAFT_207564 [Clohesyomyces aquaticus]|uniref:Uncharacterized protein n=1 Tax=Clohesyomyces aquaticus TaxID=1231657 RepID=A0A1Y2AA44_9PLEO|nr:hypothetical protein BCR34DRAFT_207564 [Clohesyomyces aquaticus]
MQLSWDDICATFDSLVREDILVYGRPQETIEVDCEGYPLQFKICPALSKKPHTIGAKLDPSLSLGRRWGPGSDLFCPDERLKIAVLNGTHDLALNLFCVDRPQFLLLTLDSYRRQHEPLDVDDFSAALNLLRNFPSIYVLFNGGSAAGCSRVHKHLQGLLGPPRAFDQFVSRDEKNHVPFKYFSHYFDKGFSLTDMLEATKAYQGLLSQSRDALKHFGLQDSEPCAHGLVMWQDWMIMIPRRRSHIEGAGAATGGMMGCIWSAERKELDEWSRLGCRNVFESLGIPP